MPQISVIVPVYRAEEYLCTCVESILAQSFRELEVILVDDGSPDGCGALCDGYAARDRRVRVLHQENQGQAAARNHALTLARGQWLCFVDSDDAIHPEMIARLHRAAMETGADISMCRMWEAPALPEDFLTEPGGECRVLKLDEKTMAELYDREEYPAWVACAKLLRRELVEAYPFRQGRVYEDNEAVCRWLCPGRTLASLTGRMYYYRTNPGSTTQSEFSLKKLDYLWALERITGFYRELGWQQLQRRFYDRYLEAAVSCCNGARYLLGRPEVVRGIERDVRRVIRQEGLGLTRQQFEALLDTMHPRLIRLYWPAAGLCRRIGRLFGKGGRP